MVGEAFSLNNNCMRLYKVFFFVVNVFILFVFASCFNSSSTDGVTSTGMCYASFIKMEETDSFTRVSVTDPWHPERTKATYVLVSKNKPLPTNLPQGTLIRVPVERAVLTSSVHMALLFDLHAEHSMVGVTDTAYVVSNRVRDYWASHKEVINMGSSMSPDVERIKAARAEVLLVSPFENADFGALGHSGIPLIECADYMETSPLGRAEWMRFYGRLFGQAERSDSLFESVEKNYLAIKERVQKIGGKRPSVVCDLRVGGLWYQPGGNSTMGRFIKDAGGDYLWAERKESGSIPMNVESVLVRAKNADIWLVKYGQSVDMTYSQMKNDSPLYTQLQAWKNRQVWACNTMKKAFYEEVPFHPDLLLKNLENIFHPTEKTPCGQYYIPMK